MPRQLSLLAADVATPLLDDLEGLLCGPGQLVFDSRGRKARLSVLVDEQWRADILLEQLRSLELSGTVIRARTATDGEALSVRTPFTDRLVPLGLRWWHGAAPAAPSDLRLDGGRLWWWTVAAGRSQLVSERPCYLLRLSRTSPQLWTPVGAALAATGLAGAFLGPRADGPAYRLVGERRLKRLAELLGEPPPGAPVGAWPGE